MTLKEMKYFLLSFILILSSISCYNNHQRSMHLIATDSDGLKLSEKKDLKLSLGGNNPQHILEYDVYLDSKLGYSPINHLGVQFRNVYFSTRGSSTNKSRITQNELSIGYYNKFEQKRTKRRSRKSRLLQKKFGKPYLLFDIYGGYQLGTALIGDDGYTHKIGITSYQNPFSKIHFNTYFLRSGIHLRIYQSNISLGFLIGRMDNYKGKLNLGKRQEFTHLIPHFQSISKNRAGTYWIPTIKYLYGKHNLKIYSGFSLLKFSQPWQFSKKTNDDGFSIPSQKESMIHFGVNIDIDGVFKALKKLKI